jgi:Flp pilus assembly protein TadB
VQKGDLMETKPITIRVNTEAARIYEAASSQQRKKLDILLSLKLSEAAQAGRPLEEIMDEMSRIAQERGLTPAILRAGDHATG